MPSNNNAAKKAARPGKQRRQAAMPGAAAPPPPPPPAATTTAQQRTAEQQHAPAQPEPKVEQQAPGHNDMPGTEAPPAATQQEPPPPAPAADQQAPGHNDTPDPNPQEAQQEGSQAPPAPAPGNGLEKSLGISLGNLEARNLAREIPRSEGSDGYGSVLPPLRPRHDPAARRDKVRGQASHPRREPGQLNPGVRRFAASAVRVYADERAIKVGEALDEIIETGMRLRAPDVIAEEYAERCRALGVPNDWHDTRRELLADILRQVPPQMVVEVYQELTQQHEDE